MTLFWPLPALLTWATSWLAFLLLLGLGLPGWLAFVAALSCAAAVALRARSRGQSRWRSGVILAGFPLSVLLLGTALPAWVWLLPLAALLALYPLGSWRDAPLFPTPSRALLGLAKTTGLPATARIADAGCGLGAGLVELHGEFPDGQLTGWEWSWPLTLACRLRCRFARVRRADIWAADWSTQDLVYLFQRPESMPRAVAKAAVELPPGAWLVSLEFEAPELLPQATLNNVEGKPVWLYRAPFSRR
ncbi:class I SAM-dependent methyltransferase [Ideonella margarita]|uniref:Class I SAM-dependent methyltransferase n=1 Tax=Ideonella margarita TaxID=2984191 RepID=A0ABU9C7D1_9BURK